MTAWFRRVIESRPFTWQAYAWMSLGLLALSPAVLVASAGFDIGTWRLILLVTILGQGGVFGLSRFILGSRRIVDAPVLAWTLIAIVSFTFPVLFRISAFLILPPGEFFPGPFRFFTVAFAWAGWILVFGAAVQETGRFRAELGELRARLDEANQLERDERATLVEVRGQVVREIQHILATGFDGVIRNASAPSARDQLQDLIDEVVRPLAEHLGTRRSDAIARVSVPGNHPRRVRLSAVLLRVADSNPFDVRSMVIAVIASTFFMRTWIAPPLTALATAAIGGVATAVLLFAARVAYDRFRHTIHRVTALFSILAAMSGVAAVDAYLASALLRVPATDFGLLIAVTEFGVLVLMATLKVVPEERTHVLNELDAAIARVNLMVTRLSQLVWVENSRLARLVHGDIQARILSTALMLDWAGAQEPRASEQLRQLQESCLTAISHPVQDLPLTEFLRQMQQIWMASVAIEHDLTPAILRAIDEDSVAKDAVSEIVREAVNNAVKHCRANTVQISAGWGGTNVTEEGGLEINVLHLDIRNNCADADGSGAGKPPAGRESRPGSGSHMFDALSAKWALRVDADDVVVSFEIPLRVSAAPVH